MNPNVAPETQFVGQPAPEIPPQPSVGFASAQTPEQPFTITGPAQPIQQEAPVAPPPIPEQFIQHTAPPAPEAPAAPTFAAPEPQSAQAQPIPEVPVAPTFSPPEAQITQPQPIPEVTPVPQPYPSPETQASNPMTQNLGPDIAVEQAQAAAAMAIPDAPLLNNSGGELNTAPEPVVGIDPSAEKPAETQNSDTEKKITNALAFAQSAWETAGRNTDPDYTKAARAAIQGALEKDLTAIMGQEWKVPEPEETWS